MCHLFDEDLGHLVVVIQSGQVEGGEAIFLLHVSQLPGTRQDHLCCTEETQFYTRSIVSDTMVNIEGIQLQRCDAWSAFETLNVVMSSMEEEEDFVRKRSATGAA